MGESPSGVFTFLVTDIVGSVTLWEDHAAAMSAALARHDHLLREQIERHGGQAFKGSGDGVWSVFAAPRAALDAAVAIQGLFRAITWGTPGGLGVRIAVHTGVAEPRDGDYFGHVPNQVARLLEWVQGGQIIASEASIQAADFDHAPSVVVRRLGSLRLRKMREPLAAVELAPPGYEREAAPHEHSRALGYFVPSYPYPTPDRLIGRHGEIARLDAILRQGREHGQVALIGGPAGAGKSALIGAAVRRAQESQALCLAGGAYEQEGVAPLGPLRDALADYLLAQPPDRVRELLGGIVYDLLPVVPELAYHLAIRDQPADQRGRNTERLFGAVYAGLRVLAEHQPVLLCLEDLHVADDATVTCVQYLVRRTRRLPLVIIGTYRTEDVLPEHEFARFLTTARRQGIELIELSPLDRPAANELVATILKGPPSERLQQLLYSATEGNPLFLEQSVLALREEGHIDWRGAAWHTTEGARLTLPTAVRAVLERRFSRLSPNCYAAVAMAAVLGRACEHAVLVEALQPEPEIQIVEHLEEAIQANVLQEMPDGYAFTHTLLRDALYGALSVPRRMLLHARAGEALERLLGERVRERPAELAHHFAQAGAATPVRERALRYSLEAGRRAAALSLHHEEMEHFGRACQLLEELGGSVAPEVRLEALEGRGNAEWALGLWLPVMETFQDVLALTEDPLRRARARGSIGHARQRIGDTASAVQECDAALAELADMEEQPDVSTARLRLLTDKAYLLFLQGRFREQAALGAQMLDIATKTGLPRPLQWSHNVRGLAAMGSGQVDVALEEFAQFLSIARHTSDQLDQAMAHSNLGIQYQYAGEFAMAQAELTAAIHLCHEAAAEHRAINTIQRLGWVYLGMGDLDSALQQAEYARDLASKASDRWGADCHDLLGMIAMLRVDWTTAQTCFETALRLRMRGPHVAGRIETLLGLGQVHQRTGVWPAADAAFTEALALAESVDPSPWLVAARRHLGWLRCLRGGDGRPLVASAVELAESMPRSVEYGPALLTAVEAGLWQGDPARATAVLERARACSLTAELRIDVLCALAVQRVQQGDIAVAFSHVERARTDAARLGAPRSHCVTLRTEGIILAASGDAALASARFEEALTQAQAARLLHEQARVLAAAHGSMAPDRADAMLSEAQMINSRLGIVSRLAPTP